MENVAYPCGQGAFLRLTCAVLVKDPLQGQEQDAGPHRGQREGLTVHTRPLSPSRLTAPPSAGVERGRLLSLLSDKKMTPGKVMYFLSRPGSWQQIFLLDS